MPVNAGLAHLSDLLFTTGIAVYSLALVSYCGAYAFGRQGRVARTSAAPPGEATDATVAEVLLAAAARAATTPTSVAAAGGGSGVATATATAVADRAAGGAAAMGGTAFGGTATGRVTQGGAATGGSAIGGTATGAAGSPAAGRPTGERFGRVAFALTALGLAVHVGSILLRAMAADRPPWGNMYEFSSAVGAVAIAAFVIAAVRQPQIRHLGMFVMLPVILLMFLAGTVLYAKAAPLVPALRSYWLAIHVTAAVLAVGIFMVSAVVTMLYLVRERWERAVAAGRPATRFPITLGRRLPQSDVLDRVAYRTIAFGFPIWTFGIIAGAIWAEAAWGRYWGWDPKETWAFVAWVIYAAYLHARATAGWRGVKAARINLLGFGAMIFNFFVVNIVISGLHSYAGLS